jgi:hypothetical protein
MQAQPAGARTQPVTPAKPKEKQQVPPTKAVDLVTEAIKAIISMIKAVRSKGEPVKSQGEPVKGQGDGDDDLVTALETLESSIQQPPNILLDTDDEADCCEKLVQALKDLRQTK